MHPSSLTALRLRALTAALGLAFSGTTFALNPAGTSVTMFEWDWNDLAYECTQFIGPAGYGAVQISPPAASLDIPNWYGIYQPVNYVNLLSRMGTQAQLQSMINTCHAAGVRVYADLVMNQMAGTAGTSTDGSSFNPTTLAYPYFSAADFHATCQIVASDYNSAACRTDVQTCRLNNLPDLNSESSYVRGQLENYMDLLLSMGVDGFRIDAAKHQAATSLNAMLTAVKATHPKTNEGESIWVTQEVIPDGEAIRSDYYQNGTLNEFEFTYAVRDAFRKNSGQSLSTLPTMMGTYNNYGGTYGFLPSSDAVVFVNNWDSERDGSSLDGSNYASGATNDTQGTHRYDLANIFMLAQAYGQVQVESGFRFTDVNADRPTASPYSNGVAQINVTWDFIHRWGDIAPMVKFHNAVGGQAQSNWVSGTVDQIAFSRGAVGFVALNNSTTAWTRTFTTGLPAGTYCNVVHGVKNAAGTACASDTVVVSSTGTATITVAADGGTMVPAVAIYTGQKL